MKIQNPRKGARTQGFTLIELLVVISIIAILAGFALPVFTSAQKKGRITDSLSNCKQVNLALRMYSGDNDGNFPATPVSKGNQAAGSTESAFKTGDHSNRAFENLMPKYTTSKKIFANKGSAYCKSAKVDSEVSEANLIQKGQNDWLYVSGLSDTSDARWPLVATATFSSNDLTYRKLSTELGGVWGGTDAVVGYCDGSARPVSGKEMDTSDPNKTYIRSPLDGKSNILTGTADWLGTSIAILCPE